MGCTNSHLMGISYRPVRENQSLDSLWTRLACGCCSAPLHSPRVSFFLVLCVHLSVCSYTSTKPHAGMTIQPCPPRQQCFCAGRAVPPREPPAGDGRPPFPQTTRPQPQESWMFSEPPRQVPTFESASEDSLNRHSRPLTTSPFPTHSSPSFSPTLQGTSFSQLLRDWWVFLGWHASRRHQSLRDTWLSAYPAPTGDTIIRARRLVPLST